MLRLGLIGHPIRHSLSPFLHQAFAEACGHAVEYLLYDLKPHELPDFLNEFAHVGIGLNVTAPYKTDIINILKSIQPHVLNLRAANLLWLEGRTWHADNVDGLGFSKAIDRWGPLLEGSDVLILGAGSVVASILPELQARCPHSITIASRRGSNGLCSQSKLPSLCAPWSECQISQLNRPYDCVIQATSAGVLGERLNIPDIVFSKDTKVMDLNYGVAAKIFLDHVQSLGVSDVMDGILMLCEQAALSYARWTGVMPDLKKIYASDAFQQKAFFKLSSRLFK